MSSLDNIQKYFEKLEDKVEKKLDKLEEKIDKLSDISTVNAIKLAENTTSLVEHMRRTEILEEEVKSFNVRLMEHEDDNDAEHKDIRSGIEFYVKFPRYLYMIGKWLTTVTVVFSGVYYIYKFISSFLLNG